VNIDRLNNRLELSGKVAAPFSLSHESFGERFFTSSICIKRMSGYKDILPITVPENLLCGCIPTVDSHITVIGQLRSYNIQQEGTNKLILTAFAKDLVLNDEEKKNINRIELKGHICKPTVFRMTPFKREIADILVAINRAYGKSDYIPCIAWGRNARIAEQMSIGDHISVSGRLQSRMYEKRYEDGTVQNKIAYEVSANNISVD